MRKLIFICTIFLVSACGKAEVATIEPVVTVQKTTISGEVINVDIKPKVTILKLDTNDDTFMDAMFIIDETAPIPNDRQIVIGDKVTIATTDGEITNFIFEN